jgi:DNA sulfur modification protein DndD
MRLARLQLLNWRSFPSCDIGLDQDITVLIGQNGTGKTALLNAFVWGLFGQTTAGFSRPDDLCNHQAKLALSQGESTQVEVVVTFLHDGGAGRHRFEARRSLRVTRTGPGKEDFEEAEPRFVLNRYPLDLDGDARMDRGDIAEREVQAIIPAGLNPYFFFPAENIGASINAPDSRASSIREAVDVLLGTTRYEIAVATIQKALHLRQLQEKRSNDTALRKAQEEQEAARKAHEGIAREQSELPGQLRRVNALRDEAEEELQRIQGAEQLINERQKIQGQYNEAQRKAEEAEKRQRRILHDECFNLFGTKVLGAARQVLDKAKADGSLPPKVSAGLLDELIENADSCLCGQQISDTERDALRALRAVVVEDALAESASSIRARVIDRSERLSARAGDDAPHAVLRAAETAISDAHRDMTTWHDKREQFDEDNPQLSRSVGANPVETWKKYLRMSNELEDKQKDLERDERRLSREKSDAQNKYEQLRRAKGKADAVAEARGRLFKVERVIEDLKRLLRNSSRRDVERAINKIVREIFLRDYTISVTSDFDIEVRQDGLNVGASSSERAWVTFAFVAAIAGLVEKYDKLVRMDEAGEIELDLGSGYPLVLDAPFSPFGDAYATQFAEKLPNLGNQSVLIIRDDHLDHLGPIMTGSVDVRAYLMQFYSPREVEQTITWGDGSLWGDGSKRTYVKPADDSSQVRTELVELPT